MTFVNDLKLDNNKDTKNMTINTYFILKNFFLWLCKTYFWRLLTALKLFFLTTTHLVHYPFKAKRIEMQLIWDGQSLSYSSFILCRVDCMGQARKTNDLSDFTFQMLITAAIGIASWKQNKKCLVINTYFLYHYASIQYLCQTYCLLTQFMVWFPSKSLIGF